MDIHHLQHRSGMLWLMAILIRQRRQDEKDLRKLNSELEQRVMRRTQELQREVSERKRPKSRFTSRPGCWIWPMTRSLSGTLKIASCIGTKVPNGSMVGPPWKPWDRRHPTSP